MLPKTQLLMPARQRQRQYGEGRQGESAADCSTDSLHHLSNTAQSTDHETEREKSPTCKNAQSVHEFIYNSIRSVHWDSRAQGLLIDRSLFERELLSPGDAQGPAPHTFRATQFRSFVRQLHRYGFRRVPGRAGSAAPGDAGAWLHYSNPCFRRGRPDLLLHVRRRSTPNRPRLAAGQEGRRHPPSCFQQHHPERVVPSFPARQPPESGHRYIAAEKTQRRCCSILNRNTPARSRAPLL
nr:heat shock factor protein 5-like [Taeniopygia guttata]